MAFAITNDKEIGINNYKYKLAAPLNQRLMSRLPSKVNTGADSYDQENYLSNWIIKDLRGGIGIDEMDESIHSDRCWWTNCIISHDGHLLLPRLATTLTIPSLSTPAVVNGNMELDSGWTGGARSATYAHGGTYSWRINTGSSFYQDEAFLEQYKGRTFTLTGWVYSEGGTGTVARIGLYDGVNTQWSAGSVVASWVSQTVNITVDKAATTLRVKADAASGAGAGHFDDFVLSESSPPTDFIPKKMVNFNGNLYLAVGNIITKMNAGRTAFTEVVGFTKTITDLIPSLNSRLYIYLGDATNYWYMATNEAITESNSANAFWGIQWGDLLWKLKSDGTFSSSSDPDGAGPTWANEGDITDIASQIESLLVGPDSTGASQIYCATNSVLKIYDDVNNKWLDTQVRLPNHPNGGKGACYWNDAIYLSAGLGVTKYVTGSTGSITEVGLDRDGGLPVEYNGEIVKFCGDSRYEMFALVDASQVTGTAQSGLYSWDGKGWFCYWADANNDAAMYDVIVSSAESSYSVYWSCGSLIYYIDLPRGLSNPKQLSTQTYATSGIFLSSWFDANSSVFDKLAQMFRTFAKGITTTETVVIKYRTNRTYMDRDSGWTTLDTLDTAGENGVKENVLSSGAGVKVQAIQYRLDLARGATTTLSPDIQSLVLSYLLLTGSADNKAWDFTVNIDGGIDNTTAGQQFTNIWAALTSDTLIPLNIWGDKTDEPHYVKLFLRNGDTQTGREFKGQMNLTAIEL